MLKGINVMVKRNGYIMLNRDGKIIFLKGYKIGKRMQSNNYLNVYLPMFPMSYDLLATLQRNCSLKGAMSISLSSHQHLAMSICLSSHQH